MTTSWWTHILKSRLQAAARRIAAKAAAPVLGLTDTTDTDEASDGTEDFIDGAGI
jgi:hypothetical protein